MKKNFLYILGLLVAASVMLYFTFQHTAKWPYSGNLLARNNPNSATVASGDCVHTQKGSAVNWHKNYPLTWDNFSAGEKGSPGFAVATASSNFGYELTDSRRVKGKVYVRFYCEESWKHPRFAESTSERSKRIMQQVLAHEQKHFDISEIYGRKFYKGIEQLKKKKKLNEKSIKALYKKLQEELDNYQDLYDDETDHSTNGTKQRQWNRRIAKELKELEAWADYGSF